MSDFNKFGQKSGDSINLSEIGDKIFTITAVEDSPYTKDGEETPDISGDSGLGNLPPLSDFDSQSGLESDGGLPPLGSFDSDKGPRAGRLPG